MKIGINQEKDFRGFDEWIHCRFCSKTIYTVKFGFAILSSSSFVLGAVTPAVIVPSLLSLQNRGYGVAKGIPTLVIAAASCDDVLAISAFGVILGTAFATGRV